MSMSDCERCWNTPCSCGWDYIGWSKQSIELHIKMLTNILSLTIQFKNNKEDIKKEFLRKQRLGAQK